jgi:hypothetical protein
MRVNTNSKAVTLDKKESDRLKQTREIIIGLAKHADGELQEATAVAYEKMLLVIQGVQK